MVKTVFKGGFDDNFTYLLSSPDGYFAIVDPCCGCAGFLEKEHLERDRVKYILVTHGHSDHLDGIGEVRKIFPQAQVCGSQCAEFACDIRACDGAELEFGAYPIKVLHTPGHSRDSVCYIFMPDNALFTGDTVFIGCIGFCRSPEVMARSLEKIKTLPDELVIFSGHDYGDVPFRTLGEEKKRNPELNDAFIAELHRK